MLILCPLSPCLGANRIFKDISREVLQLLGLFLLNLLCLEDIYGKFGHYRVLHIVLHTVQCTEIYIGAELFGL